MNMALDSAGMAWTPTFTAVEMVPLLAIVLSFILLLLLSMGGLLFAFVKALRSGGSTQKLRRLEVEEARAFQDLQRGFSRMEERIDSLETLFIGPSRHHTYDTEF